MLFFTFIKGGGVTPLTGPLNLNGFSSIIRGGKSLLTNVNKKMFFLNEGFPKFHEIKAAGTVQCAGRIPDKETGEK